MTTVIVRIVWYGAFFAASYFTGRYLGRLVAKSDRKHRIKSYHSMNKIRKDCGLSAVPPSHFSLWASDVNEEF